MAISESERRELHAAVERGISARAADLLLAMTEPELPFVLRSEMAELRGDLRSEMGELRVEMADLRTELRGEMGELRAEMADLRTELRGEMGELRVEMADLRIELHDGIAGLRVEMADLRTEIGGKLDAMVPKLWAANMASMVGVAGLVIAAAAVL